MNVTIHIPQKTKSTKVSTIKILLLVHFFEIQGIAYIMTFQVDANIPTINKNHIIPSSDFRAGTISVMCPTKKQRKNDKLICTPLDANLPDFSIGNVDVSLRAY